MGRHQQAESSGIISFVICAIIAWLAMNAYTQFAPAIWRVTQRLFTVCSGIVAGCGVVSFSMDRRTSILRCSRRTPRKTAVGKRSF